MNTPKSPNPTPESRPSRSAVDVEAVYYKLLQIAHDLDQLESDAPQDTSEVLPEVEDGTH